MITEVFCLRLESDLVEIHDVEDDEDYYYIVSNLSCPECKAFYLMYHPTPPSDETDETPDSGSV